MAWRSHGGTNNELIINLYKNNILKTDRIINAMKMVDRANYLPKNDKSFAYRDQPHSIGYHATISAPHMHAYALEALQPKMGDHVLDIGSGSGYLCAVFCALVGPEGKVYGIEHVAELNHFARDNFKRDSKEEWLDSRVEFITGDGRQGYAKGAPYDVIHCGAAFLDKYPQKILEQLKEGGKLFIPVEKSPLEQIIILYEKTAEGILEKFLMPVMYVPLTSLQEQLGAYD